MLGKQYALTTDKNAMTQIHEKIPKVNGDIDTTRFVGANVGSGLGGEVGIVDGDEEGMLVGYFC